MKDYYDLTDEEKQDILNQVSCIEIYDVKDIDLSPIGITRKWYSIIEYSFIYKDTLIFNTINTDTDSSRVDIWTEENIENTLNKGIIKKIIDIETDETKSKIIEKINKRNTPKDIRKILKKMITFSYMK